MHVVAYWNTDCGIYIAGTLPGTLHATGSVVGEEEAKEQEAALEACTSHPSCANESSSRCFAGGQAGCDIVGIMGGACMCGIPVVNGFIDMVTPEQVRSPQVFIGFHIELRWPGKYRRGSRAGPSVSVSV